MCLIVSNPVHTIPMRDDVKQKVSFLSVIIHLSNIYLHMLSQNNSVLSSEITNRNTWNTCVTFAKNYCSHVSCISIFPTCRQ